APEARGMETFFPRFIADLGKVPRGDFVLSLPAPGAFPSGLAPRGSRSTATASAAMHLASGRLRDKVFAIAAHLLECAPADLELRAGGVGVVGVPGAQVSLAQVAQAARPGWEITRPPEVEAGLEEICYWQPQTVTWSYAVH